jgi:hypothetical protein
MIRLYKVSQDSLVPVTPGRLAYEDMIQRWIEQRPELLGLNLLIIGREVVTTYCGFIDLLGIDDEVDLAVDELGRDLGGALGAGLRPAIFDRDGAALDPAKFVQSLNKSSGPWTPGRSVRTQDPNSRQLCRLLRARSERPR